MKHISNIDNVENLRALIRHELRELGIKVPKPKKSRRCGPKVQQDVNKSQIFGNYLAHVHCVHVPDCGYVAQFLVEAAEIILANIENEGIFRKSGAVSRQKEIKQQLENGKGFVGANVHDVTTLVKQFFRELPEPLFTSVYHDTFVRCYQLENQDESRRAILLLCHLLPGEHISTLRFILKLLCKIAENSAKNKMDSTNLAVVLAPNIMHVNSKSETMKSCEEKLLQVQTSVVELLINNANEVGMVDEQLVEKTAFMSEVFSTDDELDASEDNLEDTKETRKKEKKRKRSGSFQGFVSSIAQSITKWRRSTDGKTNTSGISQGSNLSHMSNSSHTKVTNKSDENRAQNAVFQFSATDATPVMRRKKAAPGTEGKAFSASKKKAILHQLPQQVTLASTPFTPASSMKKMDINSVRRGAIDTPSMPPRPYQCTPRQSMKTPRKKLTLFSPASTTKKKRYSSTSNLSVQSANKKVTKSKGIFRRLSGSKGDQAFPGNTETIIHHQIGQRLASPTSTATHQQQQKTIKDESPIAAIAQNSSFSASVCEQSVISNCEDESRSLNEGFIMTGDDKEVDISRIMSEPVISGSYEAGEYVMLGDTAPRESVSDSTILCQSRYETPKGHNRSYSMDSMLDCSTKNTSLKRGRPNSIKAGLLQGNEKEVQKLRRSFGLDKSEIGYPIPINVADVTDADNYIQLDCSLDDYVDSKHNGPDNEHEVVCDVAVDITEVSQDSPGSVSRCKSTVSVVSVDSANMKDTDSAAGYECDDESEAGFSTISGGTAVFVPELKLCQKAIDIADNDNNSNSVNGDKQYTKTLADQKQQSKDSLFSETSASFSPPLISRDREMTRSISADSGKGSMCEEPMDDCSSDATPDSIASSTFDYKENSSKWAVEATTNPETKTNCQSVKLEEIDAAVKFQNKKSVSSQDLNRDSNRTPTRVSRSKSLLDSSMGQRKTNMKPNLQISAETHKLLARAGYIKEEKAEKLDDFDDFAIPANVKFPLVIKQAETLNPRRESLIAIQKNNAGHVRNNVKQFDRIAEDKKEIVSRHASPFRFPNSTTRKRGMSPLTIPNAFAKNSEKDIEEIKQALNTSSEKVSFGTAKVPISTQLIKISESDESEMKTSAPLKRKPSIYYADKDGAASITNKYRNLASNSLIKTENESQHNITQPCDDKLDDSVFETNQEVKTSLLDSYPLDLDQSLQDTIISVCTPRSEKLAQNSSRIAKGNKENSITTKKCPEIKSNILTTPVKIDAVTLRTASNKTPIEILKTSKSPRSPVKPLKRLGSSPHSPRCRTVRSPKMVKNNRCSLLSTIPNQFDELNNL